MIRNYLSHTHPTALEQEGGNRSGAIQLGDKSCGFLCEYSQGGDQLLTTSTIQLDQEGQVAQDHPISFIFLVLKLEYAETLHRAFILDVNICINDFSLSLT